MFRRTELRAQGDEKADGGGEPVARAEVRRMRVGRLARSHLVTHVVDKDVLQVDSEGPWHVSFNAGCWKRCGGGLVVQWASWHR